MYPDGMVSIDRAAFGASLIATLVLAVLTIGSTPTTQPAKQRGLTSLSPCRGAKAARTAQTLYRMKDFAGAYALDANPNYDVLDVAWKLGFDPATRAISAYEALLVARSADLALEGIWVPEIEKRLADRAAHAAIVYMSRASYPEAKRALETAIAFHSTQIATVDSIRGALRDLGYY
jgi:hypothetical protein